MTATDRFHRHLGACAQCDRHPFDLCATGVTLLAAAALYDEDEDDLDDLDDPDDDELEELEDDDGFDDEADDDEDGDAWEERE